MRDRLALHLAAGAITAVILAPLALPGYVLSYDMNFVPAQPMRLDLLAPVDSAPRAVPLDAAISLLNTVVPGWLLQRLILAAVIWAAVVGAGRLVPTKSLPIRLIAAIGYGWTPFLAERLLIGQWGLLVAYAAMPWLVMAALKRNLAYLTITAGLCALTPSGGLMAAVVCLALLPWRRWGAVAGILLLVNSPWLVAAAISDATARSDPAGVAAFAARAENWAGATVALLGTGGIWNQETTPASRSSPLIPFLTLGLLVLAIGGYQLLRARMPSRFPAIALAGLAVAALSTFHFGATAVAWLVENLPGAGLLRDSQKFALPYALLLVLCVALGAERLADKLPAEPGRALLVGVMVLIVGGLPDLAFGGAGALKPVRYPADWEAAAQLVRADPGQVLSLPLSEYRTYSWNRDRTVLDPAPRYFSAPVLADDTLVVGDQVIAGENPRLPEIRARLASGEPVASGAIRWVLVQYRGDISEAVRPEHLRGLELIFAGPHLALYSNLAAAAPEPDRRRHFPVIAAEIAAILTMIVAAAAIAVSARR